ncbi:MAG: hypothetical protein QOJ73_3977 [Streptosporangiaceae bacterium]|jgi:outer membrane lipoprotein-sorting protein|nr:hypothetical protein [Streptosporangiaceae bacterium]
MAAQPEQIGLPGLVVLLYRADWTRLCLSATVHARHDGELRARMYQVQAKKEHDQAMRERPPGHWSRHLDGWPFADGGPDQELPDDESPDDESIIDETRGEVLLAPGGRYRVGVTDGPGPGLTVCDGESQWDISEGVATRRNAGGAPYLLADLTAPSQLLADFALELAGTSAVGGRTAHRIVATPRPAGSAMDMTRRHLPDQVFALVDTELGILLSYEEVFDGQQLTITELTDLLLDPPAAAEPGQFRPPAGMPVEESEPPGEEACDRDYVIPGVAGQVARLVAGPAAAAIGFAARHVPVRSPASVTWADDEPGIPGPGRPTDQAQLMPVTDDLVTLLYRSGLPPQAFTAVAHEWVDGAVLMRMGGALRAKLPPFIDGILGPDQLWDALGERFPPDTVHRISRLTVATPGRYRIDHLAGARPDEPVTIACDGERLWKVYPNRVATGAARPLRPDFARLADQSYLLSGWELAAGEAEVDGRRGFLVVAGDVNEMRGPRRGGWLLGSLTGRIEVVVDAELGIALRETTYFEGQPIGCLELRNVSSQVDPGGFRIDAPAGTRTVAAGPLSDVDLPGPLKAAKVAAQFGAAGVVAGAVALTGWLQKRPAGQQPPPGPPPPGDS